MKKVVEDPYIWEVPNSLTDEFCDDSIKKFEEDPGQDMYQGVTGLGYNPDIKETHDLVISTSSHWKEEDEFICKKLSESVNEYYSYLKKTVDNCIVFQDVVNMNDTGYHIQKYVPNIGFYAWHNDYHFDENMGSRFLTFIWYLNTVENGGETEFTNGMKIKAEKGKLVMFPSTWTYTHRGCMPYSGNKYILTGWMYNGWYKQRDTPEFIAACEENRKRQLSIDKKNESSISNLVNAANS